MTNRILGIVYHKGVWVLREALGVFELINVNIEDVVCGDKGYRLKDNYRYTSLGFYNSEADGMADFNKRCYGR